jgi:hypothetical protein
MTAFHDLACAGQIAYGTAGASGPLTPAFCFVTERGRETLKHLSRDPHPVVGAMVLGRTVNVFVVYALGNPH